MTSIVHSWQDSVMSCRSIDVPDYNSGRFGQTFAIERLPAEPIGTTTVTFSGVNAGSEIRVYLPDGTAHAGVESCDANHALTWVYFAAGNSNNTVTIRIVHPSYKIKEFEFTTAPAATQSIPVQQEPDKWYSNPA